MIKTFPPQLMKVYKIKSWIRMFISAPQKKTTTDVLWSYTLQYVTCIIRIRVPYQKLYNVQDSFVYKLKSIIYNPFRMYSVVVMGLLCPTSQTLYCYDPNLQ